MQPEFSIVVDPAHPMLRITMAGFFAQGDVARLVAARDAAQRGLAGGAGSAVTLVDIRGMKIQAQSSVAAFTEVLADPNARSRRIAFVVEGNLSRMQISRASRGRGRLFRCPVEAERWLLEPGDRPGVTGSSQDRHPNDAEHG